MIYNDLFVLNDEDDEDDEDDDDDDGNRWFDPDHPWAPDHTYSTITHMLFDSVVEDTMISFIPANVIRITLMSSPGVIFRAHDSQSKIRYFNYFDIKGNRRSDFSKFTGLTRYCSQHLPLIAFPVANLIVAIQGVNILDGDIRTGIEELRVSYCSLSPNSLKNCTSLKKLIVLKSGFVENKLPILPPGLEVLDITKCGNDILFSNIPRNIQSVNYREMGRTFADQLGQIQIDRLDLIKKADRVSDTYHVSNRDLISVNGDDLFFADILKAHRDDMVNYELTKRYLLGREKTTMNHRVTRSMPKLVRGREQPPNPLLSRMLEDGDIEQRIEGYIRNTEMNGRGRGRGRSRSRGKGRGTKRKKMKLSQSKKKRRR
jgi:hypothetical protein